MKGGRSKGSNIAAGGVHAVGSLRYDLERDQGKNRISES
jgi:hypothetical protein